MRLTSAHRIGFALVFLYLIAWLDRMAINMTIPFMATEFNAGPKEIGWMLSSFFVGYALFQIPGGMLVDKIGPRKVIIGALAWWSLFTVLTGVAQTLPQMLVIRFLFGAGEALFPAAVWKILSQWFTKKNRSAANAMVISSVALGPALTPLILAPIISLYGWRVSFYVLGAIGLFAVPFAWRTIADSIFVGRNVEPRELERYKAELASAEVNSESSLSSVSFSDLLRSKEIWVLFSIGLIFNITMYGWLTWLPSYLMKVKQLDLKQMAFAASLPFFFGAVGCSAAGLISDKWFRGRRKNLVLFCMIGGGLCLMTFTRVADPVSYMILQCLAGFLLFMACGAIWTLPMILLPTGLMGRGSALINTGGQIGGVLTNILIGYYVAYRGGDYGAGFDVMLGALVIAAVVTGFGIREKSVAAKIPVLATA